MSGVSDQNNCLSVLVWNVLIVRWDITLHIVIPDWIIVQFPSHLQNLVRRLMLSDIFNLISSSVYQLDNILTTVSWQTVIFDEVSPVNWSRRFCQTIAQKSNYRENQSLLRCPLSQSVSSFKLRVQSGFTFDSWRNTEFLRKSDLRWHAQILQVFYSFSGNSLVLCCLKPQ